MGNKDSKKDLNLYFGNNMNNQDEDGLDLEITKYYLNKASSCIFKIKLNTGYGIGFFCKIPLSLKKELLNALIISPHILTKENLLSVDQIIIDIDKKEIKLSKKNRRIFYNSELDYLCIEILKKDKIKDFYLIDDSNLTKNINDEFYINNMIIIISIMKNGRIGIYNGIIKSIKNKQFIYESNIFNGNNGGIILNPTSNTIIGMHFGEKKDENKNTYLNIGNLMRYIIDDINNVNNSKKKEIIEINKNNNIKDNKNKDNYNNEKCLYCEKDKPFKIILGGDTYSGKTSFLGALTGNSSNDISSTLSASYIVKNLTINNSEIFFDIWDSCRWAAHLDGLVKVYLKGSNGILLLFSLIYENSFESLDKCYKLMEEVLIDLSNIPILLLGTHSDLYEKIVINREDVIEYSKKHNFIGYFEVSSKEYYYIQESFEFLANAIYLINIKKQKLTDIDFKTNSCYY